MFPAEVIAKEAIKLAESDGIVFIDEVDKVGECVCEDKLTLPLIISSDNNEGLT